MTAEQMRNFVCFPGLGIELSINPVAFTLFGHDFYWYGLIIACGFLLAVSYAYKRAPEFGIVRDEFLDQMIFAVILGIICTRAYYVIFNYDLYRDDPMEIFRIWDGGLAIYGGIIGGIVAILIYCGIKKLKRGAMLDLCCLPVIIGQIIGRWGNFVNKEAHGGVTDSLLRMGIYEGGRYLEVHPTFLYESLWNLVGFVFLHFYSKKHRKYDGQLFWMYVAWYGVGRGFIEGLRTDSLMISLFGTQLRVSQLLAFASFLVAMLVLLGNELFRHHRPEEMAVFQMKQAAEASAAVSAEVTAEAQDPVPADGEPAECDADTDETEPAGQKEDNLSGGKMPAGPEEKEEQEAKDGDDNH